MSIYPGMPDVLKPERNRMKKQQEDHQRQIIKRMRKKKESKTKQIKVLVPVGCRSDAGLSAPIIKRLQEHPKFEAIIIYLSPADFKKSYISIDSYLKLYDKRQERKVELVLCVGDRVEMCASAAAAFHNHVKIAHIYAGVVSDPLATLDDINRHCISLWADIAFCEDEYSAWKVKELWNTIEKLKPNIFYKIKELEKYHIHNVGITHLDDLEVDENLVPSEPYDLLLLNPTTLTKESLMIKPNPNRKLICIGPNPDGSCGDGIDYDNLPRPQFFGLLKNCTRFITNSSAAYYEAPYFLKPEQIVLVGERNKNRSTPSKLEVGASDKIVKILEEYFAN